jgi:hypothetical protein
MREGMLYSYTESANALVCKRYGWPRYFRLWIWRWRPVIDTVLKTWNPTCHIYKNAQILLKFLPSNLIIVKFYQSWSVDQAKQRQIWKPSYDVTLFMCQSRSTIFLRILICVMFRPRDIQEYICMFSIALDITVLYLKIVRHQLSI